MTNGELDFFLNEFIGSVPGVTHVVAVSADGLLIARSHELTTDRADQVAAVASGLVSLLNSAAKLWEAGIVESNMTEFQGGFMFSMSVSSGASLLALAERRCDIGQVSHALTELINRVGPQLTPHVRAGLPIAADRQR